MGYEIKKRSKSEKFFRKMLPTYYKYKSGYKILDISILTVVILWGIFYNSLFVYGFYLLFIK